MPSVRSSRWCLPLCVSLSLLATACGGGGTDSSTPSNQAVVAASTPAPAPTEAGAPALVGNTAIDGTNWFNFRRQQMGMPVLLRNAAIEQAAQNHSRYQQLNDTITHDETAGAPGFAGVGPNNRLTAAGYAAGSRGFSYGEVISATSDANGFNAAEALIAAIYHRFVIFEPRFKEFGGGSAVASSGATYFTTDFGATGALTGLGAGRIVTYPLDGQQQVPSTFFSDNESPDPVPEKNAVGYPVSVHADTDITTTDFSIRPRGGAALQTRLLTRATDPETVGNAAAIIPLDPLAAGTVYDVQFTGIVNGAAVSRAWSFATR